MAINIEQRHCSFGQPTIVEIHQSELLPYHIRATLRSPVMGTQVMSALVDSGSDQVAFCEFEEAMRQLGWSEIDRPAYASRTPWSPEAEAAQLAEMEASGDHALCRCLDCNKLFGSVRQAGGICNNCLAETEPLFC